VNASQHNLLPSLIALTPKQEAEACARMSEFFSRIQPGALDLFENLKRWLPTINHYQALPLKEYQSKNIQRKMDELLCHLRDDYDFHAVELDMVRIVAQWGLPFLKKQGFHDAIDHSIKVAMSSISLCRHLNFPRSIYSVSVLVSLLHDPKINVEPEKQMAMLVTHPSLASALLTVFLHPGISNDLGASHILKHLHYLGELYSEPPEDLGVSAVSALMENLDSGYVVEGGFVRHLTQLHIEKNTDKNKLITHASEEAIQSSLELAEYIRMQYLAQLFSTYDSASNEYLSPVDGVHLESPLLQELSPHIHIRSGFPFLDSLPLSDVFASHTQLSAEYHHSQLLGSVLGAADNGQLNGYKVLHQSVRDYIYILKEQLQQSDQPFLQNWQDVHNRHKLDLPMTIAIESIHEAYTPQLVINGFVEFTWRSVAENYLYLKGNVSNLVALHYVVREGIGFLATMQRYAEQTGYGNITLESRFGDFYCADAWQDCLEEIAYDEEFLFLLYREIDHWLEFQLVRWPEGLSLDLISFIDTYKEETERIETVLPLIPGVAIKRGEDDHRRVMPIAPKHLASHRLDTTLEHRVINAEHRQADANRARFMF